MDERADRVTVTVRLSARPLVGWLGDGAADRPGRGGARTPGGAVSRTDERGAATVLMVGVLAVVMLLSGAAMVIAGYEVGHHRARAAADLAALSAASAFAQGADGCAQARRTAARQRCAR